MSFTPFDASEFLDSEEAIAEYLAAALEDPDPELFVAALGDVAKARGMSQIAREAGLGRESLYKALTPGSKLRYETVRKVMDALGVKLTVATGASEEEVEGSDAPPKKSRRQGPTPDAIYRDPSTTPLKATVKPGENTFVLELN